MTTKIMEKTVEPLNLKSILFSYAHQYALLMNDEITEEKSEKCIRALDGTLRTIMVSVRKQELIAGIQGVQNTKFVEIERTAGTVLDPEAPKFE